jgi:hypothetical protein
VRWPCCGQHLCGKRISVFVTAVIQSIPVGVSLCCAANTVKYWQLRVIADANGSRFESFSLYAPFVIDAILCQFAIRSIGCGILGGIVGGIGDDDGDGDGDGDGHRSGVPQLGRRR